MKIPIWRYLWQCHATKGTSSRITPCIERERNLRRSSGYDKDWNCFQTHGQRVHIVVQRSNMYWESSKDWLKYAETCFSFVSFFFFFFFHVTALCFSYSWLGRSVDERIMNPEQPDFSNARTLHFRTHDDGDNVKEESVRSDRGNIFDNVYKMTTIDRYVPFIESVKI